MPKKGDLVELEVEYLLPGGKGAVKAGGMTYEVVDALPGDSVRVRVQRIKGNRIFAGVEEIVTESCPRIAPRCSHFGECGGCVWQDIRYGDQLRLKADFVRRCFEEVGLCGDTPLLEPVGCESPFFYRNKMEFSFGELAAAAEGSHRVALGLHIRGRYDRIFDLKGCFLQSESSNELVSAVRTWANEHGLPAYDLRRHEGLLRFLTVREGKRTGETMLGLTVSRAGFGGQDAMARQVMSGHPEVRSFVASVNEGRAQIAAGTEDLLIAGKRTIREMIGDVVFEISANSFFQTNSLQAAELCGVVAELADLGGRETVYDLYCGAGTFGLCLSGQAERVVGVEASEEAVSDAVQNARLNEASHCRFVCGEVENALPELGAESVPDVVVVDPPRAGLHNKVVRSLAELGARTLIYVSCNPQTMARNVRDLGAGGYVLDVLQPVDMFPHTCHVECVGRLRRPH